MALEGAGEWLQKLKTNFLKLIPAITKGASMFDDKEDDIFGFNITPRDKFYQILYTMNKDIVRNELDDIFKRLAVLESMFDESEIMQKIAEYEAENFDKLEQSMQDIYLDIMSKMIGQHE